MPKCVILIASAQYNFSWPQIRFSAPPHNPLTDGQRTKIHKAMFSASSFFHTKFTASELKSK